LHTRKKAQTHIIWNMKRGELATILNSILGREKITQSKLAEVCRMNRGNLNEILRKDPGKDVLPSMVDKIRSAYPEYFPDPEDFNVLQEPTIPIERTISNPPNRDLITHYRELADDMKAHNKLLLDHIRLLIASSVEQNKKL